jgi:hypothetical protein
MTRGGLVTFGSKAGVVGGVGDRGGYGWAGCHRHGGERDDNPGVSAIDLSPQRIMVGPQVANCPQVPEP